MAAVIPIICEGCKKRIEIPREMLVQPLVCSECETPVEVDLYPPLVQARDKILAEQEAEKAAREAERQRQRERERAEFEAAQASLRDSQEAARKARRAREEERRRQRHFEEARLKAMSDEAERQRNKAMRAGLTIPTSGAITVCVLLGGLAFCIAAFSMYVLLRAPTVMQEIFGMVGILVAVALLMSGMLYVQIALMARALAHKLDAVRDLQMTQIESISKLVSLAEHSLRTARSPASTGPTGPQK